MSEEDKCLSYYICIDQWWIKDASRVERWNWVRKNLLKVYHEEMKVFLKYADIAWNDGPGNLYVLLPPIMVAFHGAVTKLLKNGIKDNPEHYDSILFNIIEANIRGDVGFGVDLKIPFGEIEKVHGIWAFHPGSVLQWVENTINELTMPDHWTGNYLVADQKEKGA